MISQPVKVLLIEDTQAQADLIQDMLNHAQYGDYRLEHVPRFLEGMERLRLGGLDVVLLDLNLPDMKGLGGLVRIRTSHPGVPVIILTNETNQGLSERALREGAKDYLFKSEIDEQLLSRSIRYAMERQRHEDALRESEERYALAVSGANDGLWDWDLVTGAVYFSPRWQAMLGYEDGELGNTRVEWFSRVHREDVDSLRRTLQAHLDGSTRHFEHEHRIRTRDDDYIWVLSRGLAVRDGEGKATRIAGSMTDITSRKNAEEKLLHDALHDSLTNLPNRSLLLDRMEQAMRQFRRDTGKLFAVLYFDLDRFKNINDSLGHSVGDQLLIQCAGRLERFLRPGDTLARLGGDEFAILLNDIEDITDATNVAERIHELLNESFSIDGHTVFTAASIGITLSAEKYEYPQDMLRDADLAMYRAKRSSNITYEVFDSEMHASAVALLKLETDLRGALEHDEFVMHYQPIIDLVTGRMSGCEALVRWRHPQRGLMYPEQFIMVAEETGLIVPLSWWVLEESCRQTRLWQKKYRHSELSISVNISGKLFLHDDMVSQMKAILARTELPAGSLRLEITESAIMDHCDEALAALAELRRLGIELYIDDFGTGYSSLSYLQRFAYDTLKIDKSFVNHVEHAGDSNSIVRAIIALGSMLGMKVIAEGVETPEQLHMLQELHCPEAQGYWFSRPLNGQGIDELISSRPELLALSA